MNFFETVMVYSQGEDDNVGDFYYYFKYNGFLRKILVHTQFWGIHIL